MAQAGMHALVSLPLRKWEAARKEWLMLGLVLGSMLPDADNLAVAVAVITKKSSEGLHRTFTHSLFSVLLVVLTFYLVGQLTKRQRWTNLGIGLGGGILMHILLDLVLWFDGVAILWPLPFTLNLWTNVTPPGWWTTLMMPVELLFFAFFFLSLDLLARQKGSDLNFLTKLRGWTIAQAVLFVIFLVLAFVLGAMFKTIFGAVYLLSLGLAAGVAIRMRKTIEA